jgi:hypothetical protein
MPATVECPQMAAIAAAVHIIGIGVPLGLVPSRTNDAQYGLARRGDGVHKLELADYRLWLAALGAPTPRDLARLFTDLPATQLGEAIADLEADGLLTTMGIDEGGITVDSSKAFRVHQLGVGLGADQRDKYRFLIAGPDLLPRAALDAVTYSVWCASDGRHSIYEACSEIALGTRTPIAQIVDQFLETIPLLMSAHVMFLDVI